MRIVLFFFLLIISVSSFSQTISTIAGNGTIGYSGNGGQATSAQMFDPHTVCTDNAGNIYVADHSNHVVRKISSTGIISNYAGTGTDGYSGDGGPANAAELMYPYGICVDNGGNLYITDQGTNAIRKVDAAGIITTIAGTGSFGYTGDGAPAINATLFSPSGICIDANGNIYVAEFSNQVIRKISSTGIISTFAGTGLTAGFYGDGGPATDALLSSPTGVCLDNAGNVYIADMGHSAIRKVDPAGIITTIAGGSALGYSGDGGPATDAVLRFPFFVFADNNGNLYISDTGNGAIRMINSSGIISTFAGTGVQGYSGDGGPADQAQLNAVAGMCMDNAGNIYVADAGSAVIRMIGNCPLPQVSRQPVDGSICESSNASFTLTANNVVTYQWEYNNGTGWTSLNDDATYSGTTSNALSVSGATIALDNIQYRCEMNNSCGHIYTAIATLKVNSSTPPGISINAPVSSICAGETVVFSSLVTNAGLHPVYNWSKNGIPTGSNWPSYSEAGLQAGDIINCQVMTDNTCSTPSTATSNSISITVNPLLSANINISPDLNNICAGTAVTFNAQLSNEGSNPVFLWLKNGVSVGSGASYIDNGLTNGDRVSCLLISNQACVVSPSAQSNIVIMNVTPVRTPSLSISTITSTICEGVSPVFLAQAGNTITAPDYQWFLNGIAAGSNQDSYSPTIISSDDRISCIMTSHDNCLTAPSTTSNEILMEVVPLPKGFLPADTAVCPTFPITIKTGYSYSQYLWNDLSSGHELRVSNAGTYWLEVTDNNNCKGRDSILVLPKSCIDRFYAPSGFTPNADGKNDEFKVFLPAQPKKYQLTIYSRWGEIVFRSDEPGKGWNGSIKGIKQDSNVFAWVCSFQMEGMPGEIKRGMLVLIR